MITWAKPVPPALPTRNVESAEMPPFACGFKTEI